MIQMFPARTLVPGWVKLVAAVVAGAAALAVAAHQWDRMRAWLPWSEARRLEQVTADRDRLAVEAAAQRARVEALIDQAQRVETVHRQVIELRDLTEPVIHEARSAPDASIPLDPDRADRLREHDRRLCELAPDACGGPAAAAAGNGDAPLSRRDPA